MNKISGAIQDHGTSNLKLNNNLSPSNRLNQSQNGSQRYSQIEFPTMKKEISKNSDISTIEKEAMEELSHTKWQEVIRTNSSIVSDTMMGQMVSKVECQTCKTASYSFETFFVLELEIPQNRDEITLKELLSLLNKVESTDSLDWDCPNCKEKKKVLKSCSLWKLPPILAVYFKRFERTQNGGYKKNSCLIRVNLEGEDFSEFIGSPKKERYNYSPYFIVVTVHYLASFWKHGPRPLYMQLF